MHVDDEGNVKGDISVQDTLGPPHRPEAWFSYAMQVLA